MVPLTPSTPREMHSTYVVDSGRCGPARIRLSAKAPATPPMVSVTNTNTNTAVLHRCCSMRREPKTDKAATAASTCADLRKTYDCRTGSSTPAFPPQQAAFRKLVELQVNALTGPDAKAFSSPRSAPTRPLSAGEPAGPRRGNASLPLIDASCCQVLRSTSRSCTKDEAAKGATYFLKIDHNDLFDDQVSFSVERDGILKEVSSSHRPYGRHHQCGREDRGVFRRSQPART